MGASQSTPPPAPAAPPAPPEKKKSEEFRFGQEETPKYGGAFKTKPIKRQLSSLPDAMMLYRVEARSARLAEKMDEDGETSEEIASRPTPHTPKGTESFDLNGAVEIACHRQCRVLWQAYARCKEEREEAKDPHKECNGWYETYIHCVDNQGPKLVLKAYQALTEDDPDKNIQLLRR